jgi:hypothetical protein
MKLEARLSKNFTREEFSKIAKVYCTHGCLGNGGMNCKWVRWDHSTSPATPYCTFGKWDILNEVIGDLNLPLDYFEDQPEKWIQVKWIKYKERFIRKVKAKNDPDMQSERKMRGLWFFKIHSNMVDIETNVCHYFDGKYDYDLTPLQNVRNAVEFYVECLAFDTVDDFEGAWDYRDYFLESLTKN